MKKLLCFLLLAGTLAFGQQRTYVIEKSTSLSGAAEVVTVHLPTGATRTVRFDSASVYCSVACTFTLERDGTAPSATALTIVKLNGSDATAGALAYYSSNVGSSTVVKTYNVPEDTEYPIDLKDKGLLAGQNLTIRTSSITGTARIYLQWKE